MNKMATDRFKPISIYELLDGTFSFCIPSFQRGYRWEPQQVKDLLNDLLMFVRSGKESVYYLQPLVVRKHIKKYENDNGEWDILDGQQRITTLYLILKSKLIQNYAIQHIQNVVRDNIYELNYDSIDRRINWDRIEQLDKIDYYYLANAQLAIDKWIDDNASSSKSLRDIIDALCSEDSDKKVQFIWYEVEEDVSEDLASIEIFNRLNKGRIRLTSSELIKALFVICIHDKDKLTQFATDWDIKEKRFQDDVFWNFMYKDSSNVQTRMDVLFDFVCAQKRAQGLTQETDAYRFFQEQYDNSDIDKGNRTSFLALWNDVDAVYNKLIQWFEDVKMFNYIGYLVQTGKKTYEIHEIIEESKKKLVEENGDEWDLEKLYDTVEGIISKTIDGYVLDEITYDEHEKVRRILLLFNIESYTRSEQRFPFEKYVRESWDIEHVDSQSGANFLQAIDDKISWLEFVIKGFEVYHSDNEKTSKLVKEAKDMLAILNREKRDSNKQFETIYRNVQGYLAQGRLSSEKDFKVLDENDIDMHGLGNLTLLDCKTNRGYKDAPYPYKRYCIITKDKEGGFVPMCTKNLFLKYYSDSDRAASQLDVVRWYAEDKRCYLQAIKDTISPFINK